MPRRHSSEPNEEELTTRLAADPVFAFAQLAVLVKVILMVVLLDPRAFDAFTLVKSTAAHAMSLVLVALLLWLLARHGWQVLVWSPVHVGAGALLLTFAVATPFAVDPNVALFGTFKRYLGLTQMLDNVVLYVSVATLFRDARSLRLLTLVGVGVVIPVLGYALVQRLGRDPLHFIQAETRVPISFLGNPDIAGAFVAVVGTAALGFALLVPGRGIAWYRVVLALVGSVSLFVLYLTGVRAGVLAIAGGWLAALGIAAIDPRIPRVRLLVGGGVAVLLSVAVVASPIRARLDPAYLASDLAIISRVDVWQAAGRTVVDRPVLGVGPDNFVAAYPTRRVEASIRTNQLQNSTHDLWLYAATSAGIPGLAALTLLVVLLVAGGIRLARRGEYAALAFIPLLAYLGQALVNVNEIGVDWTFWVPAGVIGGATGVRLRMRGRRDEPHRANTVGVISLVAAAVLIVLTLLPRITASEAMAMAGDIGATGLPEAIPYARLAVTEDPRRTEMWSTYGAVLYSATAVVPSVSAFGVAAEQEPWQPQVWKNLYVAWERLGNTVAAYASAQRATQADPFDGEAREMMAQAAYEKGEYSLSAAEGERALRYELDASENAYYLTVSAYVQLKDLEHAEPLARQAAAKFKTARSRLQLAAILADRGEKTEAVAILDALLADQPNNVDAKQLRAALAGQ